MFSKPVVAGVQGPSVGLGVTLLPLCDLVYCSDKATFHTPYARLGQVPEGAATLTLPSVLGNSVVSQRTNVTNFIAFFLRSSDDGQFRALFVRMSGCKKICGVELLKK